MPLPRTISIDGPAASGKSTLGKWLADELGYLFFDTGVMYRAVTWAALNSGISIESDEQVSVLAEKAVIDIRPPSIDDGRNCDILVDGIDITLEVRTTEVEQNVSQVSAYPRVRAALTAQQRRIGLRGDVVMVGRDIGTVVLPEAELKIFLVASAEERARRRYQELIERGQPAQYSAILSAIRERDRFDSTRKHAPLRAAVDSVVVDTDHLNVRQVFEWVYRLIQERSNNE